MSITIHLSEEAETKLEELAQAAGHADAAAYVQNLVQKTVQEAEEAARLQQEFQRLAEQWRNERGVTSLARRMAEHPAYRKIIDMGEKAVPLILAELEREPDHWFIALHKITGASPVPEESRGKLKEMAAAWINWGRQQGYRW